MSVVAVCFIYMSYSLGSSFLPPSLLPPVPPPPSPHHPHLDVIFEVDCARRNIHFFSTTLFDSYFFVIIIIINIITSPVLSLCLFLNFFYIILLTKAASCHDLKRKVIFWRWDYQQYRIHHSSALTLKYTKKWSNTTCTA